MDDEEANDVTSMDPQPPQPDEARDFTSFNPELLQLPEVSPMGLNTRAEHVQGTYKQWLSLPETSKKMNSLIKKEMAGTPINTLGDTVNVAAAAGSSSSSSTFPAPSHGFPLNLAHIPSQELKEQCISRINQIFDNPFSGFLMIGEEVTSVGLLMIEFKPVTKEVCKLPSFFSSALFRKIDIDNTGLVTREALIKYWVDGNMRTMDTATQIYKILKQPGREYLSQDDFQPILREILATHPGLDFIKNVPRIQEIYVKTVICRIFYLNDRSASGRLTLRDLKRGDLVDAIQQLDEEEDINEVQRYFSCKHVFVLGSTFGALASADDFMIERGDLIKYANFALNIRILDRIFSEAPRKFTSGIPGKMNYEDFVCFMLSEEDKTTESSIEYWFRSLDLDGNEKITADEMQYFYVEQMNRMLFLGLQPVPFEDILCQIIDMIAPERKDFITLRDFKRSKLSGNVFDILFNLRKHQRSESGKETVLRRIEKEKHPDWTEWDHFAHSEFLAMQDDELMEEGDGIDEEDN